LGADLKIAREPVPVFDGQNAYFRLSEKPKSQRELVMKVRHEALFCLQGMKRAKREDAEQFVIDLKGEGTAIITTNADNLASKIDEAAVLRDQLFRARIGQPTAESVAEHCRVRREEWPDALFFHFVMETEAQEVKDGPARRQLDNFSIALDALNVEAVRARCAQPIDAIFTALRMAGHSFIPRRIGSVTYESEPRLTYHFQITFGEGHASIVRPINDIGHIEALATKLLKAERLPSLLADAYTMQDQFRAFNSAWVGLEKFAHSNFKSRYSTRWEERLNRGGEDLAAEFLTNQSRRDKYTVAGKFRIIALILSPETADRDTEEFWAIQEVRIEGVHREGPRADRWPVVPARTLLEKYLHLHSNDAG